MKTIIAALLAMCGAALAAQPCCNTDTVILPGAYCGDVKINLVCPLGYMPLKDIVLDGDKLSSLDAPGLIVADDPKDYCIGKMYRSGGYNATEGGETVSAAVVCFQPAMTDGAGGTQLTGILTLVSVFFLLLTIAVYAYLPQMRDLQGLCCMCLCISMAMGFLSLGILQLNPGFNVEICTTTGFLVYFWIMAIFFWMNVICINVYRTVINANYLKKTERQQYFIYSLYAWGSSFGLLVVTLITEYVEGDHLKPGFGQNSCWFRDRKETWAFFYGPVSILLTANVTLFVLSSLTLWNDNKKYEVSKLNNLKYRFLLSLKLFLVMGITWIFEVVSFADGQENIIWKIMDTFNCLQGLVFFLILVVFRRRAMRGLADAGCCVVVTRFLADKLSPQDDPDDQQILDDEQTEVRLY